MPFFSTIGNAAKSGFDSFVRTRERQAQLSVHAYLAQLDDATLTKMGVSRDKLKRGGRVNHFI